MYQFFWNFKFSTTLYFALFCYFCSSYYFQLKWIGVHSEAEEIHQKLRFWGATKRFLASGRDSVCCCMAEHNWNGWRRASSRRGKVSQRSATLGCQAEMTYRLYSNVGRILVTATLSTDAALGVVSISRKRTFVTFCLAFSDSWTINTEMTYRKFSSRHQRLWTRRRMKRKLHPHLFEWLFVILTNSTKFRFFEKNFPYFLLHP